MVLFMSWYRLTLIPFGRNRKRRTPLFKGKVLWQATGRVNLTRLFGLGLFLCAGEDTFTGAVYRGAALMTVFPAMEPQAKLWLFMARSAP